MEAYPTLGVHLHISKFNKMALQFYKEIVILYAHQVGVFYETSNRRLYAGV